MTGPGPTGAWGRVMGDVWGLSGAEKLGMEWLRVGLREGHVERPMLEHSALRLRDIGGWRKGESLGCGDDICLLGGGLPRGLWVSTLSRDGVLLGGSMPFESRGVEALPM